MNNLKINKFYILMLLALAFIPVSASAQSQCSDIFFPSPANYPSTANIQYTSAQGEIRLFQEGVIYQLDNYNWVQIGFGRYQNGYIFEDNVTLPSAQGSRINLTPVRNLNPQITRQEALRYYPQQQENVASVIHTIWVGKHSIELVVPKSSGYDFAVNGTIQTLLELPQLFIETLKTVRLNIKPNVHDDYWRKTYSNFEGSGAAAGFREIDIFPIAIHEFARATPEGLRITRHEFGHLIAEKLFGTPVPDANYESKKNRDSYVPSDYAKNSLTEDFAEGIEAYLRTNAGQLDPATRSYLANRFSFFDEVFLNRSPQSSRNHNIIVKMISATQLLVLAPEVGIGLLLDIKEK